MRSIYLCADGLDPAIQKFRERYDPLGMLIEPHITLVFPFESSMSDSELINLVSTKVVAFTRFSAMLSKSVTIERDYLYFTIHKGADQIKAMHDCLYSGSLSKHLKKFTYTPHITVGRSEREKIACMQKEANDLSISEHFSVSKLMIENIEPDGKSTAIKEILLNA